MELPFAPEGTKKYASVHLVRGIEDAGKDTANVNQVVERKNDDDDVLGWLVYFNDTNDVLRIP
jgi:hypothetical protein